MGAGPSCLGPKVIVVAEHKNMTTRMGFKDATPQGEGLDEKIAL